MHLMLALAILGFQSAAIMMNEAHRGVIQLGRHRSPPNRQ